MLKSIKDFLPVGSYDTATKGHRNFSKNKSTEAFDFLYLVQKWPDITGEMLAKHTIPIKNSRGVLTILTDHSAFSHQLSFMQEILIGKIVAVFPDLKGKIKKITFQVNSAFFQEKKKFAQSTINTKEEVKQSAAFHPQSPLFKALKKEALEQFSSIEDQEIKESLISIYIQSKADR